MGRQGVKRSLLIAVALSATAASAQNFPNRPIRFVVPLAPAGAGDIVGRTVAAKLAELWGQQIVIDNRPGAGANIGAEIAARSPADGYTLFVASLPHAIAPGLYKSLAYDLMRDFVPVTMFAEEQFCLVVHPSLPANDVKSFIAFLKAHPDRKSTRLNSSHIPLSRMPSSA